MLNKVCILSRNWGNLIQKKQVPEGSISVFLIDGNKNTLKQLFQFLYTSGFKFGFGHKLSICFDFSNINFFSHNAVAQTPGNDLICNIVFHPAFYIKEGSPCVFYINDVNNTEVITQYLKYITIALCSQSYQEVQVIALRRGFADIAPNSFPILKIENESGTTLTDVYKSVFLNPGHYNKYLAVEDDAFLTEKIQQQLLHAEQIFAQEQPLLFRQIQGLAAISNENDLLKWKQKRYLQEIENYKTYLQVMHDQDESAKINRFYHYEYEVLPLWYKRFGHLIKVLTGVRTFKSLFNDTVKKYKR